MTGRQLSLFPAKTVRRPVTREELRLARRVVRAVRARGPLDRADLAGLIDCTPAELRRAIGIAVQWRRIEVRDGVVALADTHEEEAE